MEAIPAREGESKEGWHTASTKRHWSPSPQPTLEYPALQWSQTGIVQPTFSTGRKSFSTSIDLGLSLIGLSLKMSPKPTPLTFLGWMAAGATVPLAPSDLVLLESPPSLSEPVVSLKPANSEDGERKSSEISPRPRSRTSQLPRSHLWKCDWASVLRVLTQAASEFCLVFLPPNFHFKQWIKITSQKL